MNRVMWVMLLISASGASAGAEEAYQIRLKLYPDAGKTVTIRRQVSDFGEVEVGGPMPRVELHPSSKEETYTETTVEGNSAKPTRARYVFENAVSDNESKLPWHRRTVEVVDRGGKREVTVTGEPELSPLPLAYIKRRFDPTFDEMSGYQPKAPVAVGGSWTADDEYLRKAFDPRAEIDTAKSKAEFTLSRVYMKDGRRFGVISLKFRLAILKEPQTVYDPPAVMEGEIVLDGCIDGGSTARKETISYKFKGKGIRTLKGENVPDRKEPTEIRNTYKATAERSAEK